MVLMTDLLALASLVACTSSLSNQSQQGGVDGLPFNYLPPLNLAWLGMRITSTAGIVVALWLAARAFRKPANTDVTSSPVRMKRITTAACVMAGSLLLMAATFYVV